MNKIYYNGKIYTGVEGNEFVEAIAITGSKISAVGSSATLLSSAYDEVEKIDLEGRTLLPSLIDGHTHPITVAQTFWRARMPFTHDKEELLANISTAARKFPKEERPYLFCENYFAEIFGDEGPKKEELDAIVSDRPCRVQDFTDHACWFNSIALDLLKDENGEINIETAGIKPEFVKDENGEYTGWCLEPFSNIDDIICEKIGWMPPEEITDEMVMPLLDYFKEHGITCMMDAFTLNEESIKYFYDLDKAGKLGLFYEGSVIMNDTKKVDESIATAKAWKEKYSSEHVGLNVIKFFIDGTNELGDCCSLEPFANDPEGKDCGEAYSTEEDLINAMIKINEARLDLHIHCICDGAFRLCCDAYEKAKAQVGSDNWKLYLTLAHCELINEVDMHRVAKLGIFIDWSTHWSGGYFGESARDYLGERWYKMYDFTKIIADGGMVGFSSDVFTYQEAMRANPFFGMQMAMTRVDMFLPLDPNRFPGSVRPPESAKLSLMQLLKGYTYNNAYRMRLLDKMGTLEVGKLANMIVLNKDIFNVPAEEVSTVDCEYVIFEGKERRVKSPLSIDTSRSGNDYE